MLGGLDASIFVLAPTPGRVAATREAERAQRAHLLELRARGRRDEIPSVRCDFPCEHFAALAGLPLAEYETLFYDACLRDWPAEEERMRVVRDRLAGARSCGSSATAPTCASRSPVAPGSSTTAT